ncbi:hypothetical protein [Treponema pedis]|uniref:Uncharacterized protein n=1 Tax=Treponema pedis str. T A4 TaxID=1291379 RepID=S6A960_9SPIR|nr:hypothetical protein [Treponema pedis]AGT45009.1 hypothetical protein TPE_2537 [Treponema pedis str. T A4]
MQSEYSLKNYIKLLDQSLNLINNGIMKKTFIFFCFFAFALTHVYTYENETNWSGTQSGDYVIYRDYSWKEPSWIGFLYYNANTVGAFLYTSGGKTFVKILFSGEESDGEFVITGQNIISGINNDSDYVYAVNYLMEIFPKLYNWRTEPKNESLVIKRASKFINELQFGGENEIRFCSYIPLFYIESILNKENMPVLSLEEIGLAQETDTFFNFTPLKPLNDKPSKFKLEISAKKKTFPTAWGSISLDSQWKQDAENSFFLENEAFLAVTVIDLKNVKEKKNDLLIKYLSSSGKSVRVLAEKTDISGTNEKFKIKNQVYDSETKSIKYAVKSVRHAGDAKYIITVLTVNKSVYEKYKDYFDNLF